METLLSTVKHEVLHALGFSVSLYAFYRDRHGNPLTPRRPDTGKPPLNEKYNNFVMHRSICLVNNYELIDYKHTNGVKE